MTSGDEIRRAEQANWLLQDPLLQEMLLEIEEETLETWKTSADRDKREDCWKMYWVIEILRKKMRIIADNGQLIAQRLERRDRLEKEKENA